MASVWTIKSWRGRASSRSTRSSVLSWESRLTDTTGKNQFTFSRKSHSVLTNRIFANNKDIMIHSVVCVSCRKATSIIAQTKYICYIFNVLLSRYRVKLLTVCTVIFSIAIILSGAVIEYWQLVILRMLLAAG